MIYSVNNGITPVRLYGEVADNFLESVGVSIFDDGDVAIGESIFDLDTACDILEESGVILCEDCIVLEGKQAEEYKARKAKEKADAEKAYRDRNINSTTNKYDYGTTKGKNYPKNNKYSFQDWDRADRADAMIEKARNKYSITHAIHDAPFGSNKDKAKADKAFHQYLRTYDDDVYRSAMRKLKREDKKKRSNNPAIQHNSTIFSDIEII